MTSSAFPCMRQAPWAQILRANKVTIVSGDALLRLLSRNLSGTETDNINKNLSR